MQILILNQHEVRALLPMAECILAMRRAFTALHGGDALNPLRTFMWLPDHSGLLAAMPSYVADDSGGAMGLKVISVMPGNVGTPYDSHIGGVLLFEAQHGRLLALMDASEITAIRTAAVSGLATDLLARDDAGDLAILGSGTQARTHLQAMAAVRSLRRARVWSRDAGRAAAFAEREGAHAPVQIEVMPTVQAAVEGADIVCTTTAATTPVLSAEWLSAGAHINAVGASSKANRELDSATVARARLFVDRRESALNEAGDYLIPLAEGAISASHLLGELGELLHGEVPGRTSPADVTLFKSLGLAIEDLASARLLYDKALASKAGTWVEFGGERE